MGTFHAIQRGYRSRFVLGFVICMLINSWMPLTQGIRQIVVGLDDLLLAAATGALGFSTRLRDVRKAGIKPLILAFVLTAQLIVVGGVLTLC
ncbi:putative sulfate exporter family transporter [Pseudomonas izuensis]|uniref:Sulfate exporter family transporter n=1 Tax=Pseudomonas izuensis TaxID=2684212 RepID=A0ABM7RPQ2_9PSED|nr:putative sulfate exporter family transporter [Pseudomonas izuensis]BCX67674.1 hypothetical protein LAB08_R23100 [Pseudomonas izuensis]